MTLGEWRDTQDTYIYRLEDDPDYVQAPEWKYYAATVDGVDKPPYYGYLTFGDATIHGTTVGYDTAAEAMQAIKNKVVNLFEMLLSPRSVCPTLLDEWKDELNIQSPKEMRDEQRRS